MQVYVDASYGAHPDAKSHSKMVVTLGDGAMTYKRIIINQSLVHDEMDFLFIA